MSTHVEGESGGPRRWLLVAILCAVGVVLALTYTLPLIFVDERAFVDAGGDVDTVALQDAYNSARVPLGVVLASLVAGSVTAFGVRAAHRSAAAAESALRQADQRHEKDLNLARLRAGATDTQWLSEHLARRYVDAAAQMGHASAAVRMAGVNAMARLADDWPEQRQVCIDVLCGYLRLDEQGESAGDAVVRQTIVQQIEAHLVDQQPPGAPYAWSDMSFTFTGASLPFMRLEGARVRRLDFSECVIEQGLVLKATHVEQALNLRRAKVRADTLVEVTGGVVNLGSMTILGEASVVVSHRYQGEMGGGRFRHGTLIGGLRVLEHGTFNVRLSTRHAREDILMDDATVGEYATLRFTADEDVHAQGVTFRSKVVHLRRLRLQEGAQLIIPRALAHSVRVDASVEELDGRA